MLPKWKSKDPIFNWDLRFITITFEQIELRIEDLITHG